MKNFNKQQLHAFELSMMINIKAQHTQEKVLGFIQCYKSAEKE
jgi:hypothetical protein